MINEAAVKVSVVLGKLTPAVLVLVPAGAITTVPEASACTVKFPKFISNAFVIAIGVIIVAVAVAVACEKALVVKPAVKRNNNLIFVIRSVRF